MTGCSVGGEDTGMSKADIVALVELPTGHCSSQNNYTNIQIYTL